MSSNKIEPIFITVDPTRDTPELLKNYLSFFDKRIIGLTGSQEEIEEVANKYHVYYSYQDKETKEDYTVNHTANIYFLNKDNKIEHLILNIKGVIFFKQQKFEQAKKEFLKSIELDKSFIDPYKNLPLQ